MPHMVLVPGHPASIGVIEFLPEVGIGVSLLLHMDPLSLIQLKAVVGARDAPMEASRSATRKKTRSLANGAFLGKGQGLVELCLRPDFGRPLASNGLKGLVRAPKIMMRYGVVGQPVPNMPIGGVQFDQILIG